MGAGREVINRGRSYRAFVFPTKGNRWRWRIDRRDGAAWRSWVIHREGWRSCDTKDEAIRRANAALDSYAPVEYEGQERV